MPSAAHGVTRPADGCDTVVCASFTAEVDLLMKRPGSVTFVAVLAYLNGILNIVAGVVLLVTRGMSPASQSAAAAAGVTTSAIISLVFGVVTLIVAGGLLRGNPVSRGLVTAVMVVNVVNGILLLFSLQLGQGIVEILWALLIVGILFSGRANSYFLGRPTR
ncbi:hypothetical protein [Leifsonia sp. NPDC058248]|uniref:DUF7144 family membrane protein n=1 Tax=Leifsonia sp. NPDC058248 TaxID=3346402 RepID=UPI0036DD92A0